MGYWLKLYTDILDDPKYFRLSDNAKIGMYELFLLTKKLERKESTGELPNIEDIAFHTRRDMEFWNGVLPELEKAGIIDHEDDNFIVRKFSERQAAIPPDERMRQYRKRKNTKPTSSQKKNETLNNGYDDATDSNGDIDIDKSRDRDRDREDIYPALGEKPTEKQVQISKFINIVHVDFMSTDQPELLFDLIEDYGENDVMECAAWCAEKDMNTMSHVLSAMKTSLGRGWKKQKPPDKIYIDPSLVVQSMMDAEVNSG